MKMSSNLFQVLSIAQKNFKTQIDQSNNRIQSNFLHRNFVREEIFQRSVQRTRFRR